MLVDRSSFLAGKPINRTPFEGARGFIVLEGVNGAGKSSLGARIARYSEEAGAPTVMTREPGATALGRAIRSIVVEGDGDISPLSELLLFAADRAEHVTKVIRPALERGDLVVCDRYHYSTLAFQGFGRGLDHRIVTLLNNLAIGRVEPDLVMLLDLPPEEGLARNRAGSPERDSFEGEDMAFHERIREGFLAIAEEASAPFLVIDAMKTPDEVFAEVKPFLDALVGVVKRGGAP